MKPQGQGWSSFFCLLAFLFLSLAGCRSSSNEVLEMALRAREQDLRALKEEVLRLHAYNEALARELHAVRHGGGWPQGGMPVAPEYASQTYTLKRVTLGRGTGGHDEDGHPGDEALQVVIEPRDMADDIIKAPGSAQVTALEVTPEGLKTPLSSWNVTAEEIRKSWKQGLFSNGYVLILPWQQPPRSKQVRVVVRFHLSDGRLFEADKDILVKLGPTPLPLPKMPPTHDPAWPTPGEPLPMPKEYKPAPQLPPVPPAGTGWPPLQPTGHWQARSLSGAVKMHRPVPLYSSPEEY